MSNAQIYSTIVLILVLKHKKILNGPSITINQQPMLHRTRKMHTADATEEHVASVN